MKDLEASVRDLQSQLATALAKANKAQARLAATGKAQAKSQQAQAVAQEEKAEMLGLVRRVKAGLATEMDARASVFNLKVLFKAAENAEMRKEMEKQSKELEQAKEKINIMLYNVKSAEKAVRDGGVSSMLVVGTFVRRGGGGARCCGGVLCYAMVFVVCVHRVVFVPNHS